ncbi:DUF445 family protein [Terrilactibacillus sp. BCM23-1]|uniref:DUF445 family protein n=1 Tax=Terrilactibacillus tamarindi TaxID=2599694 RepID=A0A6N8CTS7_9BACI|nr:DUF445 domain-containing protein [Terrilactibacillus tamarindi]MTT32647.1 DUF445 family protein [Terrilactibacillus tamarindi]
MKNRYLANSVLAIVFLIFVLAVILKHYYGSLYSVKLIYFMAEAALVGGIVDWFAITALFRKPLGLPIPHTALISRHRDKLIQSVTKMVERELLSQSLLKNKIQQISFVSLFVRYIDQTNGLEKLVERLINESPKLLKKLEQDKTFIILERWIKKKLRNFDINPFIYKIIDHHIENGEIDKYIDWFIDTGITKIQEPEMKEQLTLFIGALVQDYKKTGNWLEKSWGSFALGFLELTNVMNVQDMTDSIHHELTQLLYRLKQRNHPLRLKAKCMLKESLYKLDKDPSMKSAVDRWKFGVIDQIQIGALLQTFIKKLPGYLEKKPSSTFSSSSIKTFLHAQLASYWNNFKENEDLITKIEQQVTKWIIQIIEREHIKIGRFVSESLNQFSNKDLEDLIESKVGSDLQWIRVNGSIVGAIIGFILYLVMTLYGLLIG